ncbi:ATPase, T2SS/T4P/T4SS family, partial [Planctomycetaceae bacterium]|nr:ATPase, T2SS/T4P/T4SS family [Planctomycetaceae bacterium]
NVTTGSMQTNFVSNTEWSLMARQSIFEASLDYFLAPIGEFLRDDDVTEIMVNGHQEIYVEKKGKLYETDAAFLSEDALQTAVHNIAQYVGREIDRERPIMDARLPDGSRVHAVIPPSARGGTYLTIRKFKRDIFGLEDYLRLGSLSEAAAEFLDICTKLKKNILISGGTGTGKTTLLNAISTCIPAEERLVVIEDSSELKLGQPHSLYLEAQQRDSSGRGELTIRQLFKASLRMRPDRIIVGEVRSGEALDMVQSMISGHAGSMTTVHANSAHDALIRLETLSLMSDVQLPVYVARAQVASAIHLVVQITRFSEDGSRRITRITEVTGLDSDEQYTFQDLFENQMTGRDAKGNLKMSLEMTGNKPSFAKEVVGHGLGHLVKTSADLWG